MKKCINCGSVNVIKVGGVGDGVYYYSFYDCKDCKCQWESED